MANHQLGAVLFTDIIGYSSQMASDESKTIAALKRNKDNHQKIISQFNGRIVDVIGDGHLCFFRSSLDAVYAGLALQHNLKTNQDQTQLRVGIHVGDTVVERRLFHNSLIVGDTVNIASRIESNAPGPGVWVSGKVASDLRNHTFLTLTSAGLFSLKNIPEAMEIIEVTADINQIPNYRADYSTHLKQPTINRTAVFFLSLGLLAAAVTLFVTIQSQDKPESLAILPIEFVSSDHEFQFLASAFWKQLHTNLATLETVKLASQANAKRLANSDEFMGHAEVDYFIEGTVFLENQQVILEIHIVEADSDIIIFSEQWQEALENIEGMQQQATADISQFLSMGL